MRIRSSLALRFVLPSFVLALFIGSVRAAAWNGIEPLKSRRPDVEKILGKPISETSEGALHFAVAGGTATVSFVDEKFVNAKRLRRDLVGTVLEVVLVHENSSDTPESIGLTKNRAFERDNVQNESIFRNLKDGILYTFLDGKLHTTRFTFSADQLGHARRSGGKV
jgi:hypothetical protein